VVDTAQNVDGRETMGETFEITAAMTKKDVIDQHNKLLGEYQKKVVEARELEKRLTEAQKHQATVVSKAAAGATVEGVLETLGQLRTLTGKALTDLAEKMAAQAERLELLNSAISVQEKRLKELHDIEAAADSLAKLTGAWSERSEQVEKEFSSRLAEIETTWKNRLAELEGTHADRKAALEGEFAQKKETLVKEMEATRLAWKAEQERVRKETAEDKAELEKQRKREEAEYTYTRDRTRKLEEDEYAETKAAQEKALKEQKETAEREFSEREIRVSQREDELENLRGTVDSFPKQLAGEVDKARKETTAALVRDHKQEMASAELERSWEKKVYEERIKHLDSTISSQEAKITELKQDLGSAVSKVQQIADKAVEGASLTRAFQSVNQIALEQARRPDQKSKE